VATTLTVDAAGNTIIAGIMAGDLDFGAGMMTASSGQVDPGDAFVAKFDPTGIALWSHRYGDREYQNAWQLRADASSNIYVFGGYNREIDFGQGPLPVGADCGSAQCTSSATLPFLVKLDPDGNTLWSRALWTDDQVTDGSRFAVDPTGRAFVGLNLRRSRGCSAGEIGSIIAAYGPDGGDVWLEELYCTSTTQPWLNAVELDAEGSVIVIGSEASRVAAISQH
jgi:hypothetical protein